MLDSEIGTLFRQFKVNEAMSTDSSHDSARRREVSVTVGKEVMGVSGNGRRPCSRASKDSSPLSYIQGTSSSLSHASDKFSELTFLLR